MHIVVVRAHGVNRLVVSRQCVVRRSAWCSSCAQGDVTYPHHLRECLGPVLDTSLVEVEATNAVVPDVQVVPTSILVSVVVQKTSIKVLTVLWPSSMHHPASTSQEQRPGYRMLI